MNDEKNVCGLKKLRMNKFGGDYGNVGDFIRDAKCNGAFFGFFGVGT